MLLSLHRLLWGAIGTSVVLLATSAPLTQALKENCKSLSLIILLAFVWRLPFEGHFFYGQEYEDSYIYTVAARYLASNTPHAEPATSPFLTTVCAAALAFSGTPYGVRSRRIGSGPLACLGVRITVCKWTPSRIGIMTS